MYSVTQQLDITQEDVEFLIRLYKEKYAEYRDSEDTLDKFLEGNNCPPIGRNNPVEYFLTRNFGGTYLNASKCAKLRLVEQDNMAWHTTYKLTELGKLFLTQNNLV